jgi:hypothetical protein
MPFLLHDSKFICTCIFDFCFISLQFKKQAFKNHTDCYDHSTPIRRSRRGPESSSWDSSYEAKVLMRNYYHGKGKKEVDSSCMSRTGGTYA